jgi:hypothetical protein
MATATLTLVDLTTYTNFGGGGFTLEEDAAGQYFVPSAGTMQACLSAVGGGSVMCGTGGGGGFSSGTFDAFFADTGAIPLGATINSVELQLRAKLGPGASTLPIDLSPGPSLYYYFGAFPDYSAVDYVGDTLVTTSYKTFSTGPLLVQPGTGTRGHVVTCLRQAVLRI